MITKSHPTPFAPPEITRCPTCLTPLGNGAYCQRDGTLRRPGVLFADRYLLEHLLGSGRMGFVFAARHRLLGKAVAIKVLRPKICADADQVQRFLREAQLCSQLQHENIVTVADFGQDARGSIFLTMERLEGQTLAELLVEEAPLATRRALDILRQICRALESAHRLGIVHRALTPRNIFVTEVSGARELVKLLDFGISPLAAGQVTGATAALSLESTPYLSPEQLRGEVTEDKRVDIYALGVLAYRMLTSSLPFCGTSLPQLIAEKLLGQPSTLSASTLRASAPAITALIEECMNVDPCRRPASASEVEQRLFSGVSPSRHQREDLSGVRAGSYRLVKPLGSGAIGAVWLGEHPVIGSRVAIKILHPELSESEEVVRRFVVEAQAVNRVQSPHIVKTFDFGKLPDGRDFAVMELLCGETLAERFAREPRLSWPEARRLLIEVVWGLADAHRAGIVHRDLKPANIHLESGSAEPRARLLDFGIAKLLDSETADSCQTGSGVTIGTPLYAAPEQVEGRPVGPPADIYALGIVAYELLSGSAPYSGSIRQVISAKLAQDAPSLANLLPALPLELVQLVDRMLQREPEARPTADEVLAFLSAMPPEILGQKTFGGAETPAPSTIAPPSREERLPAHAEPGRPKPLRCAPGSRLLVALL